MDVFLMIRHRKSHVFCDAKESSNVLELKKIIQGILKHAPENQQLYKVEDEKDISRAKLLEDNQSLLDVGLSSSTAKAQQPAIIGLALRQSDGTFEPLELTKVSDPPELPDVMKAARTDTTGEQSEGQGIS